MYLLRSFICMSPVGMKPMHNINIKKQLRAFLCLGLRSNPLLATSGVYLKPSARKMQNMIRRQNQGILKLLRVLTLGKFSKTALSLKRSLRHTQRHTRLKILYVGQISTIKNSDPLGNSLFQTTWWYPYNPNLRLGMDRSPILRCYSFQAHWF